MNSNTGALPNIGTIILVPTSNIWNAGSKSKHMEKVKAYSWRAALCLPNTGLKIIQQDTRSSQCEGIIKILYRKKPMMHWDIKKNTDQAHNFKLLYNITSFFVCRKGDPTSRVPSRTHASSLRSCELTSAFYSVPWHLSKSEVLSNRFNMHFSLFILNIPLVMIMSSPLA